MALGPELQEQHAIRQFAEAAGCVVYVHSQHRKPQRSAPQAGHPDLTILLPNQRGLVYWETKVAGGTQRKEQYWFELACVRAGVRYGTGTCADFHTYWEHLS